MIKKTLAAAVFMLAAWANAQTPEQFDKTARQFFANNTQTIDVRPSARTPGEWIKMGLTLANPKWDVKKTDSLLNPAIAFVTVQTTTQVSNSAKSREEAQDLPLSLAANESVELQFTPTSTGWSFKSGRAYVKDLNQWFPITPPAAGAALSTRKWLIDGLTIN